MPFQKGHTLRKDGVSGIKKGTKHKKTILKNNIEKSIWESSSEKIEKNIQEFLHAKDKKTRLIATQSFTKFFKPQKKEITGEFKVPIIIQMNPKITSPETSTNEPTDS